jgi:hypothetical protein
VFYINGQRFIAVTILGKEKLFFFFKGLAKEKRGGLFPGKEIISCSVTDEEHPRWVGLLAVQKKGSTAGRGPPRRI